MGCRVWRVYDRHAEARRLLTLPRWLGGPDYADDRIAESIQIQSDITHRDFSLPRVLGRTKQGSVMLATAVLIVA
jgi:hypothetical protein